MPSPAPDPVEELPPPAETRAGCANCGRPAPEAFCSVCGQRTAEFRVSLGALIREFTRDFLDLDGKVPRSLYLLFRRPGVLTTDYLAGRRVRHVGPFKLYLLTSVLFFFVWGLTPSGGTFQIRTSPNVEAGEAAGGTAGDEMRRATVSLTREAAELEARGAAGPASFMRRMEERLDAFFADPEAGKLRLNEALARHLPKAMFVLMPLFALLTGLFFWRRYYVEHFIFALHLHAAAYLVLALAEVLPFEHARSWANLALIGFLYLSLRRVYGRTRLGTSWRAVAVGFLYFMAVGAALLAIVAGTVLVG